MKIIDIIKMGFKNIMRKKMRTFLTVLSFAIGSFSIVIMISLGIGMTESYKHQIMKMGNLTTISVNSYGYYDRATDTYVNSEAEITDKTLTELEAIEGVEAVTPVLNTDYLVKSGKYEAYLNVQVLDFDMLDKFGYPDLVIGNDLTLEQLKKGVILGGNEYGLYFYNPRGGYGGDDNPVDVFEQSYKIYKTKYDDGKEERIKLDFDIVGQFEETNGEVDYYNYMDIDLYYDIMDDIKDSLTKEEKKELKDKKYRELKVCVSSINEVERVQQEIKDMGYGANSLSDMLDSMQEEANILQLILGGIGGVSLFVAAIGIANTMVMSTYERTKEIGVMKVLGCKIEDIKKMFLFEAGIIGCIGGLAGVLLSYAVAYFLNKYAVSFMYGYESDAVVSVIPLWLMLMSLGFSFLIGMIAGYFPARRATKIRALEALKTE